MKNKETNTATTSQRAKDGVSRYSIIDGCDIIRGEADVLEDARWLRSRLLTLNQAGNARAYIFDNMKHREVK